MLTISDLQVGYDESLVLQNINLIVEEGKIVSLLGRNGAGKTTLVKSIIGLLKSKMGSIDWNGENITSLRPEERVRKGIGYVPQGREIFSSLLVEENLLLGLEALPKRKRIKKVSKEIFELFPVLKDMLHRKGGDLSGGQQQQLAIARALIGNPNLLLLDEPMEGIQPSIVDLIQEVIMRISSENKVGVILVDHSLDIALECSDYYYVIDKGTIVAEGKTAEAQMGELEKLLVV